MPNCGKSTRYLCNFLLRRFFIALTNYGRVFSIAMIAFRSLSFKSLSQIAFVMRTGQTKHRNKAKKRVIKGKNKRMNKDERNEKNERRKRHLKPKNKYKSWNHPNLHANLLICATIMRLLSCRLYWLHKSSLIENQSSVEKCSLAVSVVCCTPYRKCSLKNTTMSHS